MLPAGRHWLGLGSNPAGFEFQWQCRWRIWPCLVSDWLAGGLSKQKQPTTRLACSNGHECYRLGNDCIQFKLSHKPGVAGLNCGRWQYNKRNFTYLHIVNITCHIVNIAISTCNFRCHVEMNKCRIVIITPLLYYIVVTLHHCYAARLTGIPMTFHYLFMWHQCHSLSALWSRCVTSYQRPLAFWTLITLISADV